MVDISQQTARNGFTRINFDSYDDLVNSIIMNDNRHLFEVVHGDQPGKFYLDIDASIGKFQNENSWLEYIIRIRDHMAIFLESHNIVIYTSPPTEGKYSAHLVSVDVAGNNNDERKLFAFHMAVWSLQNFDYNYIDLVVYKKYQLFRCIRQSKIASSRIKDILGSTHDVTENNIRDSLIHHLYGNITIKVIHPLNLMDEMLVGNIKKYSFS
jgi:hypothetical protein